MHILDQALLNEGQRLLIAAAPCGDRRQIVEGHLLLLICPGRLVESIEGLVIPLLIEEGQSQIIESLAVIGIVKHAVPCQAADRCPEIPFRLFETPPAKQQQAVCVVDAGIPRISLQPFEVVGIRKPRGVAVLLDMLGCQEQLLIGQHLFRCGRRLCRLRKLRNSLILRLVRNQFPALSEDSNLYFTGIRNLKGKNLPVNVHGRELRAFTVNFPAVIGHDDIRRFVSFRAVHADVEAILFRLHTEHRVDRSIFHLAHRFVGHEILMEHFLFVGLQPAEIRLVIAVHAGHELNVRAILVRKVSVPGFSEITAPPGPLLLARRNVVIRHMEKACLLPVIVPAHKIVFGFLRHIGSGNRNILIPGNVNPLGIIVFIILTRRDRKTGDRALAVVINAVYIRRENGLCVVIDRNRRIRPPQKRLRERCPVVQLSADLNISAVRVKGKAGDLLGAVHLVYIVDQE